MNYFTNRFDDFLKNKKSKFNINYLDVTEDLKLHLLLEAFSKKNDDIVIVCKNVYNAKNIYDKLRYSLSDDELYLFLNDEFVTTSLIASSSEYRYQRIEVLLALNNKHKKIIVTHTLAYIKRELPLEKWQSNLLTLEKGMIIEKDKLVEKLVCFGYLKNFQVEGRQEFSTKGFTVDIFPLTDNPIRIYFFDNEIESIKYFNIDTQRTIEEVEAITLHPMYEFFYDETDKQQLLKYADDAIAVENYDLANLEKYIVHYSKNNITQLMENPTVVFFNYERIKDAYNTYVSEFTELILNENDMIDPNLSLVDTLLQEDKLLTFSYREIADYDNYSVRSSEIIEYNQQIKVFKRDILSFKGLVILENSATMKSYLENLSIDYYLISNYEQARKDKINLLKKDTGLSFMIPDEILYISSQVLTKRHSKKRNTKIKNAVKIQSLDEIMIGDYVVHVDYGIGIYRGIKTIELNGNKSDYIHIDYKDSEALYVPVEKFSLIMKYASSDSFVPRINSINSTSWAKAKARARKKIKDLAVNLVKIYGARQAAIGYKYASDTVNQTLFENDFGYELTPDQKSSLSEVKKDMESRRPMDRLLCGDVGFGKTEVAARAAFKACENFKQVAYLCPTTILSKQHYVTLRDRFAKYNYRVELINRYIPYTKQKIIIEDLKKGKIDVLIGTHRILNKVFKYCDLGLLIIDEEQRFGVNQKEKIKELKMNVDVLTLTATPIPRTLQMSIIGIRDVSLINTPPKNRYPVQTYAMKFNKVLIKSAIERELSRNGQIYYLYNHVDLLEEKALMLKQLCPKARIVTAHGRMKKDELEKKMEAFIDHEYDILVCTTIIETGVDIANCNTLFIDEAYRYGLAQLYQIRGRVGRSDRIAYAYLLINENKSLNEIQEKRLDTIKEFTSLGSGYKIANRDLSIRGAGDILGAEQSGFINDIGIELYMKFLEEEVNIARGKKEKEVVNDDRKRIVTGNKHIDDAYVKDDPIKMEMHKKIYAMNTLNDYYELQNEFMDKYGIIDEETSGFMKRTILDKYLLKFDAKLDKNIGYQYYGFFMSREKSLGIDGESLMMALVNTSNNIYLKYTNERIHVKIDTKKETDYLIKLIAFLEKYMEIVYEKGN